MNVVANFGFELYTGGHQFLTANMVSMAFTAAKTPFQLVIAKKPTGELQHGVLFVLPNTTQ